MALEDVLFIRKAEIIVGQRVTNTNSAIEPAFARVFKTRLNFTVTQDGGPNANKAKIDVYNLAEESRTFLEQKDMIIFLQAGYDSTGLSTLFFGNIDEKNGIHTKRKGADIITTIEAGDAEKTLRESNIQLGLSKGATNIQIIEQAALKLLVSTSFKTNIKLITFQKGFTYSGPVKELLNTMAKYSGFEWSIQNGELQILSPEETDQQEAVFLSSETGLLGYPTKTQDKIEFISLLNPAIRPGRAVRLESKIFLEDAGANVKVEKTTFKGDNREGPWEVKAEGTIING